MKILAASMLLLLAFVACAEESWKTVDEGFRMTLPASWQHQHVQPIDSNCGAYKGTTADLEFDEVFGLGVTTNETQASIADLKKKEANPKLLKTGEEVWHVDGRIAYFSKGKVNPKIYGQRRFSNVACLYVPYAGEPGYLSIYIIYKSSEDLPTVLRVLKSVDWKKRATSKKI